MLRRDTDQHCESDLLRSAFDSSNVGSIFRVISQLQRHGAQYSTIGLAKEIKKALKKLQAAKTYNDHSLHFLKKRTYELGERSSQVRCRPVRRQPPGVFCFEAFTPFSRPDATLSERRLSSIIGIWLLRAVTPPS